MNARERILSAIHGQPVDRIPFVPLIDPYTFMDMPPEFFSGGKPGIEDLSGFQSILAGTRKLGCDVMLRHVPVTAPAQGNAHHLQSIASFDYPIETNCERRGDEWMETMVTARGTLTGVWRFTSDGSWIPHPVHYPVSTLDDLRIFHHGVDHLTTQPPDLDVKMYQELDQEIGDDGIATVSLSTSPLMYLIEEVIGLENTYYFLQDCRAEVEEILAKLHAANLRMASLLASSPAQIVICYEDTSTTLMSPAIFRRYCKPCLDDYARVMQAAGKIFLVHMCGKLHALVKDLATLTCTGISDISPPPTGDLPLAEAAALLPGKIITGGIDPNTFISTDSEAVEKVVSRLVDQIIHYPGVLLGSADTMPRGTRPENIRLIRSIVERAGNQ